MHFTEKEVFFLSRESSPKKYPPPPPHPRIVLNSLEPFILLELQSHAAPLFLG